MLFTELTANLEIKLDLIMAFIDSLMHDAARAKFVAKLPILSPIPLSRSRYLSISSNFALAFLKFIKLVSAFKDITCFTT